jgi:hypothetical protein
VTLDPMSNHFIPLRGTRAKVKYHVREQRVFLAEQVLASCQV